MNFEDQNLGALSPFDDGTGIPIQQPTAGSIGIDAELSPFADFFGVSSNFSIANTPVGPLVVPTSQIQLGGGSAANVSAQFTTLPGQSATQGSGVQIVPPAPAADPPGFIRIGDFLVDTTTLLLAAGGVVVVLLLIFSGGRR